VYKLPRFTLHTMHSSWINFMFHSSLLTMKNINLMVARNGFLCVMEIVCIVHISYLDYRGAFQSGLDSYCCATSWKYSSLQGSIMNTSISDNNGERVTFLSGYFYYESHFWAVFDSYFCVTCFLHWKLQFI